MPELFHFNFKFLKNRFPAKYLFLWVPILLFGFQSPILSETPEIVLEKSIQALNESLPNFAVQMDFLNSEKGESSSKIPLHIEKVSLRIAAMLPSGLRFDTFVPGLGAVEGGYVSEQYFWFDLKERKELYRLKLDSLAQKTAKDSLASSSMNLKESEGRTKLNAFLEGLKKSKKFQLTEDADSFHLSLPAGMEEGTTFKLSLDKKSYLPSQFHFSDSKGKNQGTIHFTQWKKGVLSDPNFFKLTVDSTTPVNEFNPSTLLYFYQFLDSQALNLNKNF